MNVAEGAGLLVIAVIVMILLLFSFKNDIYISVQNFVILFLIFTFAIALMVYNLDPRESIRWDLLVHFETLEKMQKQGLDYVLHGSEYRYLLLVNAYFYLIALIGNFRLLPVFPVIIDFLCALYMIQDQLRIRYGKAAPIRDCALISGLWFMSFGFMLSVSGIRCVLAVALGMLGLYMEYYKKEHRIFGIFLYIVAIMTHTLGIVIPLIRLLLRVRNKLLMMIVMVCGCVLFSPIASLGAKVIGLSYFRYLLLNVAKYWSSFGTIRWLLRVYNSDRTVFLCYLLICLFNLYMLWRIQKNLRESALVTGEEDEKYRVWNLTATIAVLYVTGLFNALFTQRLTYILAYSFPLSVPLYLQSVDRNWKVTLFHLFMILIFFWLFFFNDLYIFIVNYTGVYFLDL